MNDAIDGKEIQEDDTVVPHKSLSHGNQHEKRRSAASQEVAPKVARDVMAPHLVATVEMNEMKNRQRNDVEIRNKVVVGLRNLHEKQNVFLKKNQVNVTMMLKKESEQKTHQKENHQMMHQKRIWTLQTHHRNMHSGSNNVQQEKLFHRILCSSEIFHEF